MPCWVTFRRAELAYPLSHHHTTSSSSPDSSPLPILAGYPLSHYTLTLQSWDGGALAWTDATTDDSASLVVTAATSATQLAAGAAGVMGTASMRPPGAGTFRVRVSAVNTQGDVGKTATGEGTVVPGGWCGWEDEGRPTCTEGILLIVGCSVSGALVLAWLLRRLARHLWPELVGGPSPKAPDGHEEEYAPIDTRGRGGGLGGGGGGGGAGTSTRSSASDVATRPPPAWARWLGFGGSGGGLSKDAAGELAVLRVKLAEV